MKKFIFFIIFIVVSTSILAEEWVSPIDKKYLDKDPELFEKFDQAREILDSWRGQKNKLIRADTLLREILKKDGNFAPAYREYGRLYIMAGYINNDNFKKGSLNPAESSILKSISIEPRYADAYVLLGHLYTEMNRFDDARNALVKAEEIGTNDIWLPLNWADLLRRKGQYNEALKRYQSVILQHKGTSNIKAYSSALAGEIMMYEAMGKYDKANECHKKKIAYDPNNAWSWGNYSSFLLFTYNDIDGAIENGQKAISIMNYGMGRFVLACALYTKWALLQNSPKNKDEAQLFFDKAWAIYPYPERVIKKTKNYKNTKITAIALQKWLTNKSR